jgi:hypothetical protein
MFNCRVARPVLQAEINCSSWQAEGLTIDSIRRAWCQITTSKVSMRVLPGSSNLAFRTRSMVGLIFAGIRLTLNANGKRS